MATKIRVEQINTSSWTPSSTTYLRWDGTWSNTTWWWLNIYEQSFTFPEKSNWRISIVVWDAGISPTSKVFVQLIRAWEENEEDENEIRIWSISPTLWWFYIEFDTLWYVYWEFIIYYLIA